MLAAARLLSALCAAPIIHIRARLQLALAGREGLFRGLAHLVGVRIRVRVRVTVRVRVRVRVGVRVRVRVRVRVSAPR